jgi:shikimate dehydrogenase
MRKFGLIGQSLEHSGSKQYFHRKYSRETIIDCQYENFQLDDIKTLRDLIQNDKNLSGLNVTIPFKKDVIHYIDVIDPLAEACQAVNCIKIIRSGTIVSLKGYNTDTIAFRETLKPLLKREYRRALVLGTGGASGAVCQALKDLNIEYTLVSRKKNSGVLTYSGISQRVLADHYIIVNTTPVGMYPDEGKFLPLPYNELTESHILYDLIYNPEETMFLKKGREAGARVKNGLAMLELQAELSWKIWNDDWSPVVS